MEVGLGACYSELIGRAGRTWFAEQDDETSS